MPSNTPLTWALSVRLSWIEHKAQKLGSVTRSEIVEAFGVSKAQASADIRQLLVLHPGCIKYDSTVKTYQWIGGVPKLARPYPVASFVFQRPRKDRHAGH